MRAKDQIIQKIINLYKKLKNTLKHVVKYFLFHIYFMNVFYHFFLFRQPTHFPPPPHTLSK